MSPPDVRPESEHARRSANVPRTKKAAIGDEIRLGPLVYKLVSEPQTSTTEKSSCETAPPAAIPALSCKRKLDETTLAKAHDAHMYSSNVDSHPHILPAFSSNMGLGPQPILRTRDERDRNSSNGDNRAVQDGKRRAVSRTGIPAGTECYYQTKQGETLIGIVVKTHYDDPPEPNYTVSINGKERETEQRRLQLVAPGALTLDLSPRHVRGLTLSPQKP